MVTVMSPRSNGAVRNAHVERPTMGPGPGRAVCGERAESQERMLVQLNCQGVTGLCKC